MALKLRRLPHSPARTPAASRGGRTKLLYAQRYGPSAPHAVIRFTLPRPGAVGDGNGYFY